MDNEKGKLTFSHISVKGKDKTNNTDKVVGISDENSVIVALVDPTTGSSWGENISSLLAGSIVDGIKELLSQQQEEDITQLEETIKHLIKDKISESAKSIPATTITTVGEYSIHLSVIVWYKDHIMTFAAGKTSIYKVENHQLKAVYLLMDKPPIKLNITGDIVKFSLSINTFEETPSLSSIVMASDGFYTFLKNPKIHNLLARIDSPRSVLAKLEEHLKNHHPDDNASIVMVWRETETEEVPPDELPTLTTTNAAAAVIGMTEDYRKTYDKTTVEKLTETLRNIQETEIGKKLVEREEKKKQVKKTKTSRLLERPREKREISPWIALIIVLLFVLLFGGFLYIRYGDTLKNYFSHNTTTQTQQENGGNTTTTTENENTSGGTSGTSTTPTTTAETSTETETSGEVTTPTTSQTSSTSTSSTTEVTENEETATETTETTTEVKPISVITKPSGLRITLIQTDNKGNQMKVIKSCKSPCTLEVPIDMKNPMIVAMYSGAVCASYPKPIPDGWSVDALRDKAILDCRYIAEDDPDRPILITSNPSNIRIKIFDKSGKELYSALSPFRIPVLGQSNDTAIIKAFIKDKQCAAYKDTWHDILTKKHIHLVCKQ